MSSVLTMNREQRRQLQQRSNGGKKTLADGGLGIKVAPLLQSMQDHHEYASIVGSFPPPNTNPIDELKLAVQEIEAVRQRPCLMYVGNVINGKADSGVVAKDDLPFTEMVNSVSNSEKKVDVFLATTGGSGPQIARFVNSLRAKFDEVDFLIPSYCMSAGTLFALSGDRVWMNPNACLGPIDPQVPNAEGRFVPAQALLTLIDKLQAQGETSQKNGSGVPWTAVRIIDTIDKKDLGNAITATAYSRDLVTQFLINYKFKNWHVRRTSQNPVTDDYRKQRASTIASELASHERWKNHGHALSRDVLWGEIQLEIDHPASDLERVIRRAWALCYWLFDKSPIQKIIVSKDYGYVMFDGEMGTKP